MRGPRKSHALLLVLALMIWAGPSASPAPAQETTTEATSEKTGAAPSASGAPGPSEVDLPEEVPVPEVAARAWALVDLQSGEVLAGEGASDELPTGSTSKIMTAVTALEMVEAGEASLEDEATVSERAAFYAKPLYSNAGLVAGDVLTVRELILATLIPSGNDAATALAEHLGGGGEAGIERFVGRMNREAREMDLAETRLENVTGLDGRGHRSSARDLAEMARAGFEHPLFREAVATREAVVDTPEREIYFQSTNDLLVTYARATGVKTGTSPAAGPSLVGSAAANDESYISVVLDAQNDRFGDAIAIMEHGFVAYERPEIIQEGVRYARADVPYRRGERIPLVAKENVEGLVDHDSEVEREARVVSELPDSAERGQRLGEVVARVDGERVGASPLVAARGYDEASVWERVWYTMEGFFE